MIKQDIELAKRVMAGNSDALRDLYQTYASVLHRTARHVTGSSHAADDVLHDVFVALPNSLKGYSGRGPLGAWLRIVTYRMALQAIRKARRRRETPLEGTPDASYVPESASIGNCLQAYIDALPLSLRLVFVLHDIEEYSHAEIATLLGIQVAASHVRLHRARSHLRNKLKGRDNAPHR